MRERIDHEIARGIRLVILDVDGVLTDGGIYTGFTDDGRTVETKKFEITDGLGIKMLEWAGLAVHILSGRTSLSNSVRAKELGVPYSEADGGYKLVAADRIVADVGVQWSDVACVCDDLADLPILLKAGLPVAVANAVPEVRATAHWQTRKQGGSGAVREFAEELLKVRGEWASLVEQYRIDRSGAPTK